MRIEILMAVLASLVLMAIPAQAGPFRRKPAATTYATCTGPNCGGDTSTAQGVAEIQARNRRMAHHGGNSSYEGVGMGSTPESALANCCNKGGRVIDQGVARGADGNYYACKRYSR